VVPADEGSFAAETENLQLAARFQAMSIPLLVIMRDGKEVDRVIGALPKAQIEQRLAALVP
jgi:thioredoxin 1